MPRNPEDYSNRYPEDPDLDYQEEWTTTDERTRHAENHLLSFHDLASLNRHDDMIGQHAHGAMAHALKTLISATGNTYQRIHDINLLMSDAMEADPSFAPDPNIDGSIYDQYAGSDGYYRPSRPITQISDYQHLVNADVRYILDPVQQVKHSIANR